MDQQLKKFVQRLTDTFKDLNNPNPFDGLFVGRRKVWWHKNVATGHEYRGVERALLAFHMMDNKFTESLWLTQSEADYFGVQINENALPVAVSDTVALFNIEQCCQADRHRLPAVIYEMYSYEDIISRIPVKLISVHKKCACYYPLTDEINLPNISHAFTVEGVKATVLHELMHGTGHQNRLARNIHLNKLGQPNYAREELIAEIGAVFLCSMLGIKQGMQRTAFYIQDSLKVLKYDAAVLYEAIQEAEKGCQYILNGWHGEAGVLTRQFVDIQDKHACA